MSKSAYNNIAGRNTLYTRVIELTFKRYVISSMHGEAAFGRLFAYIGVFMDIFIYSDESGVFDQKHNKFFVFAGILFIFSDIFQGNNLPKNPKMNRI